MGYKQQFAIGRVLDKEKETKWIVDFGQVTIAGVLIGTKLSRELMLELFVYGSDVFDVKLYLTNFVDIKDLEKLNFIAFCTLPDYTSSNLNMILDEKVYKLKATTEVKHRVTAFQESFKKDLWYRNKYIGHMIKHYPRQCK